MEFVLNILYDWKQNLKLGVVNISEYKLLSYIYMNQKSDRPVHIYHSLVNEL